MYRPNNLVDRNMGRAEGNLSYLQFIKLVQNLWEEAHPDIKIKPTQSLAFEKYPVIVYGLEVRKPHQSEPKPRIREEIIRGSDGQIFISHAQRFSNIVTFSVLDINPILAEEIIEEFEDFMMEYTPVFKRLGVSEFVYARRIPDSDPVAHGQDLTKRTVAYMLTTEKIKLIPEQQIRQVLIDARIFLVDNEKIDIKFGATPAQASLFDLYQSATPIS